MGRQPFISLLVTSTLFGVSCLAQNTSTPVPRAPAAPTIDIPDELKSKVSIASQHVRANQAAEALALYTEVLTDRPDLFTISLEGANCINWETTIPKRSPISLPP